MSAANLDAVKKKYNFKQISVATWRNPWSGSNSPSISPDALGQPIIPPYRVKYDQLHDPTDDEESENEDQQQSTNPEGKTDGLSLAT